MNKKTNPPEMYNDNPEWTDQTTDRATLASEVHSPAVMSVLVKRGRPAGSSKERITIRLDHDALAKFRALGPGWQTRINEVLVKAAEGL